MLVVPNASAQEWRSAISDGDYARARVELEAALVEQSDDAELRYQLARVLGYEGLNEQAMAEYRDRLAKRLNLPVVLPLEEGMAPLMPAIRRFMGKAG